MKCRPVLSLRAVSEFMVHGLSVDVCDPICQGRSCRCLQSVMQPEALVISLGFTSAWGCFFVSDLSFHLSQYWCLWSVLNLRAMFFHGPISAGVYAVARTTWKPMIHVSGNCKEKGRYISSFAELRNLNMQVFCDNPCSLTHPKVTGNPLKRAHKKCDKDAKIQLSSVDGFWQGCGRGRTWFCLRERMLKVWPCSSEYIHNTNWTIIFIKGV